MIIWGVHTYDDKERESDLCLTIQISKKCLFSNDRLFISVLENKTRSWYVINWVSPPLDKFVLHSTPRIPLSTFLCLESEPSCGYIIMWQLWNVIYTKSPVTDPLITRDLGAVSIRKTVLPGMVIPMLKIRRPNGRLIFNMEIAIRR